MLSKESFVSFSLLGNGSLHRYMNVVMIERAYPVAGMPLSSPTAINNDAVVREFHEALARSSDMAVAVAAIHALTTVIRKSTATTMMGLERELKDAAHSLQRCNPTAISLKTGCELFLRYTTRTSALENDPFPVAKKKLIERGRRFAGQSCTPCCFLPALPLVPSSFFTSYSLMSSQRPPSVHGRRLLSRESVLLGQVSPFCATDILG